MPVETFLRCLEPADRFPDELEGHPPEESIPIIDPNTSVGAREQVVEFRERFFVSCWHLFAEETFQMWKDYGKNGVALRSRFDLLKSELNMLSDRVFLSRVRYDWEPRARWNVVHFIMTKRKQFSPEQELRAAIWMPHLAPPDEIPFFQRRRVNLAALLTRVEVSPYVDETVVVQVREILAENGFSIPVRHSELAKYRDFLP